QVFCIALAALKWGLHNLRKLKSEQITSENIH
ncbi:unnamed protein product, partial [Allacma fusca]